MSLRSWRGISRLPRRPAPLSRNATLPAVRSAERKRRFRSGLHRSHGARTALRRRDRRWNSRSRHRQDRPPADDQRPRREPAAHHRALAERAGPARLRGARGRPRQPVTQRGEPGSRLGHRKQDHAVELRYPLRIPVRLIPGQGDADARLELGDLERAGAGRLLGKLCP